MSIIVDAANEIVIALNGNVFTPSFTAVRAYSASFKLRDMSPLHVTVVPRSLAMTMADRSSSQNDIEINIGIQQKLVSADNAEIDGLIGLVEEIATFIRTTRVFGNAMWMDTQNDPIYAPEHLEELQQFTSILAITLRVIQA